MRAIHIVYARWCPHCVPTTVGPVEKAGKELGVPVVLHDIDTDVLKADELVEKYGDWIPDYLVPQVFIEEDDGRIDHVLTGDPRGLQYTRRLVDELLKGRLSKNQARTS